MVLSHRHWEGKNLSLIFANRNSMYQAPSKSSQMSSVGAVQPTVVVSAVALNAPAVPDVKKPARISALDFTKGALVLIMVLYHWLNYFVASYGFFYRYLRFLTPSFIFIAGFLISNVYLSRYQVSGTKRPGRLAARGLKILAVFIVLNVGIGLLLLNPQTGGRGVFELFTGDGAISIFLVGSNGVPGGAKTAAFYILVPIGYLFLLSAGLVFIYRFYKYVFHAVCLVFLVSIFSLDLWGIKNGNLELLTMGLLGVAAGNISIDKITNLVSHRYAIMVAYLGYLAAVTIWDVLFPLQIVGVCLTLLLIYLIGTAESKVGPVYELVVLLGKYSLFGYISQIAILQFLRRAIPYLHLESFGLPLSFVLAFVLTILGVELLDRLRAKSGVTDKLYKAVFA